MKTSVKWFFGILVLAILGVGFYGWRFMEEKEDLSILLGTGGSGSWSTDMSPIKFDIQATNDTGQRIKTDLAIPEAYFITRPKKAYRMTRDVPPKKTDIYIGHRGTYLGTVLPGLTPQTIRSEEVARIVLEKFKPEMEEVNKRRDKKEIFALKITMRNAVDAMIMDDSVDFYLGNANGSNRVKNSWEEELEHKRKKGWLRNPKIHAGMFTEHEDWYGANKKRPSTFYYVPLKQGKFPIYITHNYNGNPDYKLVGRCTAETQYSDVIWIKSHFPCERLEEYASIDKKIRQLVKSFIVRQTVIEP